MEIIMSVSQELLNAVEAWKVEDEKFSAGNNAAGTRARKALQEIAKLVKTRRGEITEEKNARKEAKG
jgi:alkylhydroperoxidase family enzyme